MPEIKISEQESITQAALEVTSNSVLIPMLWVRKFSTTAYDETETVEVFEYDSASKFKDYFKSGGGLNGAGSRFVYRDGSDSNSIDRTAIMIYELLLQGLHVIIKPIPLAKSIEDINKAWNSSLGQVVLEEDDYQSLLTEAIVTNKCLDEFKNKNLYNIKFITSGAWPNAGKVGGTTAETASALHSTLSQLAADRGDSVALVEFRKDYSNTTELLTDLDALSANATYDKYSLSYFPWYKAVTTALDSEVKVDMPACFGYLMAYANSVKTNANWFAASGVIRGEIPNFDSTLFEVGEDLMRILQSEASYELSAGTSKNLKMAINSIMNVGTYGYRIWGNKSYYLNPTTTSDMYMNFANIRLLLCDIKKQIYHAAMRLTFEPNDDIVWINFKSLTNALLEKMKSGRGIVWYKWTKEVVEEKATIKAALTIKPIEAVESFNINIVLTDEDIELDENEAEV